MRPNPSGPRRFGPAAILAAVVALVACGALGFYALKKHNAPEVQTQIAGETPTPIGGPATSTPAPAATASAEAKNTKAEAPATAKKTDKTARNEETRKTPKAETPEPRVQADVGHEEEMPPPADVPVPPDFQRQNKPRKPMVRVMPGGVVIRTLPDGTQIITTPDGQRFMISKDGTRTVLGPARPNRRRVTPAPAPTP